MAFIPCVLCNSSPSQGTPSLSPQVAPPSSGVPWGPPTFNRKETLTHHCLHAPPHHPLCAFHGFFLGVSHRLNNWPTLSTPASSSCLSATSTPISPPSQWPQQENGHPHTERGIHRAPPPTAALPSPAEGQRGSGGAQEEREGSTPQMRPGAVSEEGTLLQRPSAPYLLPVH